MVDGVLLRADGGGLCGNADLPPERVRAGRNGRRSESDGPKSGGGAENGRDSGGGRRGGGGVHAGKRPAGTAGGTGRIHHRSAAGKTADGSAFAGLSHPAESERLFGVHAGPDDRSGSDECARPEFDPAHLGSGRQGDDLLLPVRPATRKP